MDYKYVYGLMVLCIGLIFIGSRSLQQYVHVQELHNNDLLVGVSAECPPFTYMDGGHLVGFDIDLMQEIGKRLQRTVQFVEMPFVSLLPALQIGSIHVIAAGLTATQDRAKRVLFTPTYLDRDSLLIVSLATAPLVTVTQLHGKRVVVNEGYTADFYISSFPEIEVVRLNRAADALMALKTGRVDAFVTAYTAIKPFFDRYGHNGSLYIVLVPGTQQNASLAVGLHDYQLQQAITNVLQAMEQDGTLTKLKTKWEMEAR